MGHPLSQQSFQSFTDELELIEKDAAVGKALQSAGQFALKRLTGAGRTALKLPGRTIGGAEEGIQQTARRGANLLTKPRQSLREGWKELSPEAMGTTTRPGAVNPVARAANWLSRSGWTGTGKTTKYLPVGMKGITIGSTALAAPEVMEAARKKPSATGEGGLAETGLGEAAGLAGLVAGGRRLIPSMALYMLGRGAGRGAGRLVDRMRGGADVGTAVSAPSPEEAQQQLSNIYRHYG